jgi:hypothetical protein
MPERIGSTLNGVLGTLYAMRSLPDDTSMRHIRLLANQEIDRIEAAQKEAESDE